MIWYAPKINLEIFIDLKLVILVWIVWFSKTREFELKEQSVHLSIVEMGKNLLWEIWPNYSICCIQQFVLTGLDLTEHNCAGFFSKCNRYLENSFLVRKLLKEISRTDITFPIKYTGVTNAKKTHFCDVAENALVCVNAILLEGVKNGPPSEYCTSHQHAFQEANCETPKDFQFLDRKGQKKRKSMIRSQ